MIKWFKEWAAKRKQIQHDREWGGGYRSMERVMERDVQEAAKWVQFAENAVAFEGWNPFDAGVLAAWEDRERVVELRDKIVRLEADARRWQWVLRHAYVDGETVQSIKDGRQIRGCVEWVIHFTGGEGRTVVEAIDDATSVGVPR